MNLVQRALGDIDGGVLATRGHGAISAEMFCAGREGIRRAEVITLKTADFGSRQQCSEPGVLPGAFDAAAPARVARYIQHRSESHGETVGRAFQGRLPCRLCPSSWIERGGLSEGHGVEGPVAVGDVGPVK